MTAFAARTTGWFTTDDCRLDDFRDNPKAGSPWEEVKARLRGQ